MVRFSVTCLKINGAWYDEGRPNVTMWGDNPPGFKTQFKIPIFIHKEDYWGNLDCYKSICGGCGLVYQYLSCLTSLLCFPILFSSSFSVFAPQQISSFPSSQYSSPSSSNLEFNRNIFQNTCNVYFQERQDRHLASGDVNYISKDCCHRWPWYLYTTLYHHQLDRGTDTWEGVYQKG